ncbi:MAG: hypothetical protein NTY90_02375, partial [Candidatus Micrarchaeota archaeon]|nr:hypothetical protein [Candidatus Micrarchaeota archaeon]
MLIRRGFVAAPLIGTIIFLAAIMFAVNLSKTDSAEVSHVVSDAYHNRIVSLLEMYRADLGAVFTVGLSRNVEYFLTGQCWASPPFNIETSGNQGSQSQALLDIKNQAYDNCVLFNKILKAVVCSIDPKYGMKAWLSQMNETTTFEGISFEPANKQSFERFITTGWSTSSLNLNNQQYASGSGSCEDLVMGSLFDCYAFAYETLPGGGPKL